MHGACDGSRCVKGFPFLILSIDRVRAVAAGPGNQCYRLGWSLSFLFVVFCGVSGVCTAYMVALAVVSGGSDFSHCVQ